jgi:hypothetical protein
MKIKIQFFGNYFTIFAMITLISCHEFRLHNDFAESLVTRGLSPLPVCVLDDYLNNAE